MALSISLVPSIIAGDSADSLAHVGQAEVGSCAVQLHANRRLTPHDAQGAHALAIARAAHHGVGCFDRRTSQASERH